MDWLSTLSLALGSAWTSGINLYATVFVLGLFQKIGAAKLPGGLDVLENWWIIGIAAFLYLIEFVADKVPYVDSVWDVVHTFIRVPAGALLAYAAVGDLDPTSQVLAFLFGGGVALSSHGTKATARAVANLSPEPISNWILSIVEDAIAFAGAILAVFAPILIGIVVLVFLVIFFLILPRVVRNFRRIFRAVAAFFGGGKKGFDSVIREAR
ncbi:MAG: DUF4126 domain-containing protein [Acidobacteriota bacterium]|nr:DUF4126 domain-containing protein [Acidobacteriota bacterium]